MGTRELCRNRSQGYGDTLSAEYQQAIKIKFLKRKW
jgi:hypothetical protein